MDYKIDCRQWGRFFSVPCSVVDDYILISDGDFVKVLLCLLCSNSQVVSTEQLGAMAGVSAEKAEDAIIHWAGLGVISAETVDGRVVEQNKSVVTPKVTPVQNVEAINPARNSIDAKTRVKYSTREIAEKIESYKIDKDPILPKFDLPEEFMAEIDTFLEKYKHIIDEGRCDKSGNKRGEEFCNSVAFLCHLTYKGAQERYGDTLNDEQAERIEFELKTICKMGFPDYFLIVQDFIAAARREGISVGPGRGSAAGSAVAYCLKITNIDPIKYDLLFERFLNPDRINMPDVDIDFDDDGRYRVFQYIEEKVMPNRKKEIEGTETLS